MQFILSLVFFTTVYAADLPIIKTKQTLNNIRYFNSEGKFTYYQRRSGDLQLSANFTNTQVLQKKQFSEFFIYASDDKEKLVIEVDNSYLTDISHTKLNDIYITDYGKANPEKIAQGRSPELHLRDKFLSFYDSHESKIHFKDLEKNKNIISIKVNNRINPFYFPKRSMLSPHDVIYTDINKDAQSALINYNILDKSSKVIYKTPLSGSRIEFCIMDDFIYLGEFSFSDIHNDTKILQIPIYRNPDYKKFKILYQSQQSDIGNMKCFKDKIYFIKTLSFNRELNLKTSEVAVFNPKNRETKILSNFKYVTQLLKIDNTILTPYRGEYYLVDGIAKLDEDAIEKKESITIEDKK